MKEYSTNDIRNIALIGHTGTGKTTLLENALYQAGAISELGSIEQGNTVSDFDEEEISRKVSVQTTLAYCEFEGKKINFIDTPGAADFVGDVRAALRVADGTVVLLDAAAGIEIGTEALWRYADEYHVPRLVYVNKMDREYADFYKVLESIKEKFHKPCVAIQIPIGQAGDFKGVIDLINMKAVYPDGSGKNVRIEEIPEDMQDIANEYREKLRDAAAETDDELIEKVLEGQTLNHDEIVKGVSRGILDYKIIPVACGSLTEHVGIQLLMRLIEESLPSPLYRGEYTGLKPGTEEELVRHPDPKEPFAAFVFKTYTDQYAGRIALLRIRSGELVKDQEVINSKNGNKAKISHIYAVDGKKQSEIHKASTGDIVALVKVDGLNVGDTLCDKDQPFQAHHLKVPSPCFFLAITAKEKKDEEKLNNFLFKASEDDPSFFVRYNKETRETVIEAMGQQQVDVVLSRIASRSKIQVETSVPRVAYKETITKSGEGHHRHKKQSGGHGQYGEVYIRVSPLNDGSGFEFEDKIVGGAIPKNFIPGVEKGLKEAMGSGVLASYPLTGIKVTLYDGTFHDVDSSEMSFKIAARNALKDAVTNSGPVLLEPVMDLTVFVEDALMGDVLSDLNSRRGRVQGMGGEDGEGGIKKINAKVPLSELLRYSADLKSLTSGKATFEMEFSHYDPLTGRMADTVIADRKKQLEEEE